MAKNKVTPTPDGHDADERVLTVEEVLQRLTLDRVTVWRMVRDGRFPKPIQLTASRIGWRLSAVMAWLRDRELNPVEQRAYFGRGKPAPVTDTPRKRSKRRDPRTLDSHPD